MNPLNLFRNETNLEAYEAGDVIFRAGEPGTLMYVVRSGEVDIKVHDVVLESVGPGTVIGEMALIDSKSRSATAVARSRCELVPIDEKRFLFLVQQTPYFAIHVMKILAERIRKMDERV